MSNFRMNPGAEDEIKATTMAKMREIDTALRNDLTGHETDVIDGRARAAFSAFGFDLTDEFYASYSQAVKDDEPWDFSNS